MHRHEWQLATTEGGMVFVIDTLPEQYPYTCECGAFTHDPDSGIPCSVCAPDDYALRASDRVILDGGPFNGRVIAKPQGKAINLRVADEGRAQLFVRYEQVTTHPSFFKFKWNNWTLPFVPHETDAEVAAMQEP